MDHDLKIFLVSVGLAMSMTFALFGLVVGANVDGNSDPDCAWAGESHQREDQKALYDGKPAPYCQRVCEDSPVFFQWGHDQDCHWEDDGRYNQEADR